jgi:uncharacterized membrane protein
MGDHQRSVEVKAAADAVFGYLANPENLPKYVATMTAAVPAGGETVHVAAEVQGRREEGDARFHADAAERRIEWSGEGEGAYSGWLQVTETAAGSTVTVHIHTMHDSGEQGAEIDRAFDETMERIKELVEAGSRS